MDASIATIVILTLAIVTGVGSRFFLKTDNPIEEVAERVIKEKTGYDIDLSPDTPDEPYKEN